jgi:hypothetical protein
MAGTSPVRLDMISATSAARSRPLGAGEDEAIPSTARFDPRVAHPARVYNLWLGGKDGYAADREAAEQVARRRPQVVAGARANRALLARVVRYLAAQRGMRQFLDVGTGLPAPGSTHEVAQAVAPESRVVYVDNDRCKSGCTHERSPSHRAFLHVTAGQDDEAAARAPRNRPDARFTGRSAT